MKTDGWYIKKTSFIISLIIALIVLLGSIISPFVWKESVEQRVAQNERDIKELKKTQERFYERIDKKIDDIYQLLLREKR